MALLDGHHLAVSSATEAYLTLTAVCLLHLLDSELLADVPAQKVLHSSPLMLRVAAPWMARVPVEVAVGQASACSVRSSHSRTAKRFHPGYSLAQFGDSLESALSVAEHLKSCRNDRYLDFIRHLFIDHSTEDEINVLMCSVLD